MRITVCVLFVVSTIGRAHAGAIASRVLGQVDFVHGAANTVDAASLALNLGGSQHIGVAVDSAGHLYVVDLSNNRVLGWHSVAALVTGEPADLVIGQTDFETGIAQATTNATSLSGPRGIAVDAAGNVYVADTKDSRVLIFPNPFTTMSQTGQTAGFVATAVIGQVGNFTSGACNVGGTSPSAETLCSPEDVALDSAGNLYVADNANNRVLEYDAPVNGSTIAANRVFGQLGSFITNGSNVGGSISNNGLKLPTGVAVDKNNNLYVADFNNNRVLEYNTPLAVTVIAGSGDTTADEVWGQAGSFTTGTCNKGGESASALCSPLRVALDGSGNLYVSDTNNDRVLEYNEGANPPTNQTATHVIGQPNATASVCNQTSNTLSASTLCGPSGLALDGSGDLFVADGNDNRVLKYVTPLTTDLVADVALGEPDFTHIDETIDPASLNAPDQLALDPVSGGIVVADFGNNRVLGWRHAATFTSDAPADLVIGQPDFYSGQLNRGGSTAANSLSSPSGVAFDAAGNLYIADTSNSRVVEYDTPFAACAGVFPCVGGAANLVFGQPDATSSFCDGNATPSSTTLCRPTEVASDNLGNLYVADKGNNRVLEYNTPVTPTMVTGSGDTTADLVFGQGSTGTGAEFTTSNCNQNSAALTATSMCNPTGVGIDPGNNLYIADTTNDRILEFNESVNATTAPANVIANAVFGQNGFLTKNLFLAVGSNSLSFPVGVSFDAAGDLFAADQGNSRVLEFFTPMMVTGTAGSGDTNADVVWGQGGDMFVGHCNAEGAGPASAATGCGPVSAVMDSIGNLYISDTGNNRITAYVPPYPPPGNGVGDNSPGVLGIDPATIRFSATRVGQHRTRSVTLSNNGSVPITIGRLSAIGDFTFFNGCPTQLTPGSSCEIRITFAPITGGRRGGALSIGDDAHASPHRINLFGRAKRRGVR